MQELVSLPLNLVTACDSNRAYDLASSLRFSAVDAFPGYFAMGWKSGYSSRTKLVGEDTECSTALALAGRLLGETPTAAALAAMAVPARPVPVIG